MRYKPAYMHACACVCVCMHLVWGGEGLPELTEELVSAALSAWLELCLRDASSPLWGHSAVAGQAEPVLMSQGHPKVRSRSLTL